MVLTNLVVQQLYSIRNHSGKETALEKLQMLHKINIKDIKSKKAAQTLYTTLLFLSAYPDNKKVYDQAQELLIRFKDQITVNKSLQYQLYNSGITGTSLCAAFGFEMVKWLRKTHAAQTRLISFEMDDDSIMPVISVLMSKAESEIFQDGNATWRDWLKKLKRPGEDMLDQLIDIFESSSIRPEVKDELWNILGLSAEIESITHSRLPQSLTRVFYHRSLIRKNSMKETVWQADRMTLTEEEAEQVIDCSRMILVRHLREIDPISFTEAKLVSYYHLPRGLSVSLMEMVPERRHPIDSYLGYVVFKNGLPVAYAGSWILFDSARIGLNIFPDYRGGETRYIFDQVLRLHASVYKLKRFSVDPFQVGKGNKDGIHSGAFWVYYHVGFRPLEKKQSVLAAAEDTRIKSEKKYRSSPGILKTLAGSRLELILNNNAFRFDATDMSRAFAGIVRKKYKGNRMAATMDAAKKLARILQIKNYRDNNMYYVLQNWSVFLLCGQKELEQNQRLKQTLKTLFTAKATGGEAAYIKSLQKAVDLRMFLEDCIKNYAT